MSTRTDAQLLADAIADAGAFRELYDRYAVEINAFLRRRTGDEQAALDLTAETFAAAWLSRSRFRDRCAGSAAPWLYAIARSKLLMSVRRSAIEARARERLGLAMDCAAGPAEPSPDWVEGLDRALAELPEPQREALRLRVEHDFSYRQVAAALGTSPEAARMRVHRALATLRRHFPNSMETSP